MDYKYKYSKQCSVCKFLKHRPHIRDAVLNEAEYFEGNLKMTDMHRKYGTGLGYDSFRMHFYRHVSKIPRSTYVTAINEKEPIKKALREGQVLIRPDQRAGAHEQTLDEFIAQFDQAVREKQFKLTVKDGLQAIKIKADMEKANKDRSKDIMKMMLGATGESAGPPERTTATE